VDRDDIRPAFWAAFWGANRALSAARDGAFERHGVPAGQHAILTRLWLSDGQTPGELAKSLDITTSAVTNAAGKLEAADLITRYTADHHVTLNLTERGHELEKIIEREMRTVAERALGSLTDPERLHLIHYLRELRANTTT
jgi:MarR family transcriptional regulator, organic hydroperoxide resistance regulator